MDKYILNPKHENDTIITKSSDGTEMVVTKGIFNDYFAECMIRNNQNHLVLINSEYKEALVEKKTFEQISDNVILLTSSPDQTGKSEPNPLVNEPALNLKDGKRFQKKGFKQPQDLKQPK